MLVPFYLSTVIAADCSCTQDGGRGGGGILSLFSNYALFLTKRFRSEVSHINLGHFIEIVHFGLLLLFCFVA